MTPLRLLLVEDSPDDAALLERELLKAGFAVTSLRVQTHEGLAEALKEEWDLALVDYALPGFGGREALEMLERSGVDIPAIVVSGKVDESTAVEALRGGARDFITKQRVARLVPAVKRELHDASVRRTQRRVREALHEAEEKMRLITAQLPAVIWTTDLDLRVTSTIGDDYMVGGTVAEVTGNDAVAIAAHERATKGESVGYDCDWRGATHHCEIRPLRDVEGTLVGAIGIAVDVSRERQATEELRLSEARFRSLIENALDIVAILDGEGRYTYVSPSFEQALGYTCDEVVGRHAFDDVHEEDRERLWVEFSAHVGTEGSTRVLEYRFRHGDGSWRTLESIGHNLLFDPAVKGVVVTSRDVSERKRLEDRLQQTRRLEAIGQLAGGVAHDFNNVLLVVRGYGALLQQQLDGTEAEKFATEIVNAADRAAGLTRQLLAFGRRQMLQPTLLDVNETVRSTESLLHRLLPEDVELITLLDELPAVVRADVSQIEQVLINLATNARDAMPHGGAITVSVSTEEVAVGDFETKPPLGSGSYVVLRVGDTGAGIEPEILDHIFEPFFTTKAQGEGTGLGLATVYGIAVQSGGAVAVESDGSGAVFSVYLPLANGHAEGEGAGRPQTQQTGNESVLLVEDEDQVRSLVEVILSGHGYRVTVAACPSEALGIAARNPGAFDLVVSDVVMPEMSGYELAEELRATQPRVRNLFISGYARGLRTVGGELEAGVTLLQKPFSADQLTRTVRQVLDAPAGVAVR